MSSRTKSLGREVAIYDTIQPTGMRSCSRIYDVPFNELLYKPHDTALLPSVAPAWAVSWLNPYGRFSCWRKSSDWIVEYLETLRESWFRNPFLCDSSQVNKCSRIVWSGCIRQYHLLKLPTKCVYMGLRCLGRQLQASPYFLMQAPPLYI